ncbi:MAG: V-type ATPase subunit [Candidatus Bathyarchaeia archaeon]
MSINLNYNFIAAKIKAMYSRLLERDIYIKLIKTRSIDEYINILSKTVYNQYIKDVREVNLQLMEGIILKSLFDDIMVIIRYSPKNAYNFIVNFLDRFEVENMKVIIKGLFLKMNPKEIVRYIVPVPLGLTLDDYYNIFEKSRDIEGLLRLLDGIDYSNIIRKYLDRGDSYIFIDSDLDKHVYLKLWFMKERILKHLDRKIAEGFLGLEADLLNIRTILRGKKLGLSFDDIREFIIPIYYTISEADLIDMLRSKDIDDVFSIIKRGIYGYLLSKVFEDYRLRNSISLIDNEMMKLIARFSREIVKRYPSLSHIGWLLSYINLKWVEARNLRIILYGIVENIPVEVLEKVVVFNEV